MVMASNEEEGITIKDDTNEGIVVMIPLEILGVTGKVISGLLEVTIGGKVLEVTWCSPTLSFSSLTSLECFWVED